MLLAIKCNYFVSSSSSIITHSDDTTTHSVCTESLSMFEHIHVNINIGAYIFCINHIEHSSIAK